MSKSKEIDRPLSLRIKCRVLGHEWIHLRDKETRYCKRCSVEESYSINETHEDEGAEKGEYRFTIRDGQLEIHKYQVTAWGEDSEHWRWYPVSQTPVDDANLTELKEEIERYVESTPDETGDQPDPRTVRWMDLTPAITR